MADYELRHPENVPGTFFTDDACIICHMCMDLAPNVFRATEDGDHAFVFRQPATEEDRAMAEEARESCPTEAIGTALGDE